MPLLSQRLIDNPFFCQLPHRGFFFGAHSPKMASLLLTESVVWHDRVQIFRVLWLIVISSGGCFVVRRGRSTSLSRVALEPKRNLVGDSSLQISRREKLLLEMTMILHAECYTAQPQNPAELEEKIGFIHLL